MLKRLSLGLRLFLLLREFQISALGKEEKVCGVT
jgi:hypothetical protein